MNTLEYVVIVLAGLVVLGCDRKSVEPVATEPTGVAAPGSIELTPVSPRQVVAGGLPVTGSVRAAEGAAIRWEGSGTPIEGTGTPVAAATALGAGNIVQVQWDDSTYHGQVLSCTTGRAYCRPERANDRNYHSIIEGMRRSQTSGRRYFWNGVHYQGQILAHNPDGTVRVHYVGWLSSWDEDVAR